MSTYAPSPDRSASRDALRAQIQTAWTHTHDVDLPLQLARENPDLADDLLDFFDGLISTEANPPTDSEADEVARTLTTRLRQTGQSHLADAIDRVRSLDDDDLAAPDNSGTPTIASGHLSLVPPTGAVREHAPPDPGPRNEALGCEDYYDYAARYDYGPEEIATALGLPTATAHKLIVNSTHCPPLAQEQMARMTADGLSQTDYATGRIYLVGGRGRSGPRQVAASRGAGFGSSRAFSYTAVFENAPSDLSDETRQFWLSLTGPSDAPSP